MLGHVQIANKIKDEKLDTELRVLYASYLEMGHFERNTVSNMIKVGQD